MKKLDYYDKWEALYRVANQTKRLAIETNEPVDWARHTRAAKRLSAHEGKFPKGAA